MTNGVYIVDAGGIRQGRGYTWPSSGGGGGPSVDTIFGFNTEGATTYQTIAGRMARFSGRAPCVRVFNSSRMPAGFNISTTVAPEKRASYSFKSGGDSAGLARGAYNATMRAWLESIPPNWTIFWTFHHEINGSGGLELPAADFVGTYRQMRACLDAVTLAAGVQVYITVNFQGLYLKAAQGWSDSWVPRKSDGVDILTWDVYGNPGFFTSQSGSNKYGGPASGPAYDTTYPLVSQKFADVFAVTDRTGFADSWGLLELNTPLRNWDATEAGRAAWHQEALDLCMAPPMTGSVPPKILLLWESPAGVQWNQAYGYNTQPAKGGTRIAYSPASGSPLWGVWAPYITGTPVGG
jgi:hypothetical protein